MAYLGGLRVSAHVPDGVAAPPTRTAPAAAGLAAVAEANTCKRKWDYSETSLYWTDGIHSEILIKRNISILELLHKSTHVMVRPCYFKPNWTQSLTGKMEFPS